ncbi:MAG: YraN family protein [Pseudomonadota bacterium]
MAAEAAVARRYEAMGYHLMAERWRGPHGEIDLILEDDDGALVFVEVKCAKHMDQALSALGRRQQQRLLDSSNVFLGLMPQGLRTACRIDLAACDSTGAMHILENALAA